MDTLKALVTLHSNERHAFRRTVDMKMDTNVSKWVMAYWMYLESNGFKGLLRKLSSHDDKFLGLVFSEAETALSSLRLEETGPLSSGCVPITSNFSNPMVSFNDIFKDKKRVLEGVSDLYNGVCSMIFEDILEERGLKGNVEGRKGVEMKVDGEGMGEDGVALGGATPTEGSTSEGGVFGSNLNPFAKEWSPLVEKTAEENRSLFMTFSHGFPLTEEEITDYFTKKYGECVENIYVHNARGREPEFGKIVFKTSFMPAVVLKDTEQARLWVNGRPMWLKTYKPRNRIA